MNTPNVAISEDMTSQLSALIAPVQGAGIMLTKLAEGLSSAVSGAASVPGVSSSGNVESVETPDAKDSASQSTVSAGIAGFFYGLFNSMNEQFSSFFTKLFGGDGEGSLFSSIGGMFGGKKGDEANGEQAEAGAEKISDAAGTVVQDQKKNDAERVKSDANSWGAMVGNALAGSKKLRKIQKAMAIGSVVIDTAKGIAKAFGEHGFPGGLIPAAIVAAKGAAEVATIKGQAHDGLTNVPSTGTYLLEKGERVVGNRLNADLQGFLASQAAVRETGGNSVTNSPTINLTINGDASEDAVASNRGALEGMIRDIFADYAMDAPFG